MPIRVECPGCQASYSVADELRGKKIRCRKCQGIVTVGGVARPASSAATQARPPARRSAPPPGRRDEDDDRPRRRRDEDDDDRPRRRRRREDDRRSGVSPLVWVGAGVGGLVVVGAIILIVVLNSGTPSPKKDGTDQQARAGGPGAPRGGMPQGGMPQGGMAMRGGSAGGMMGQAGGNGGATNGGAVPPDTQKPPEEHVKPVEAPAIEANDTSLGQRIYKRLLKSVVLILAPTQHGNRIGISMGSGGLVDRTNRLIVTNYHVVQESPAVAVFVPKFDPQTGRLIGELDQFMQQVKDKRDVNMARVVARDSHRDLALVQVDTLPPEFQALPLASTQPATADRVFSVGHPGASGGLWVYTDGIVRSLLRKKHWAIIDPEEGLNMDIRADVVLTTSQTNHGDSGGPLVNTHGQVIGIVHGADEGNALSTFIDVSELKGLLKEYELQSGTKLVLETAPAVQTGDSAKVPALLKIIQGKDPSQRQQAVLTLGQMGPDAKLAVRPLIETLKDKDPTMQSCAADALQKIGITRDQLPLLLPLLDDTQPSVRQAALQLIGSVGPDASLALSQVAKLAEDTDMRTREKAVAAVGKIATASDHALLMPVLSKALKDSDPLVREAAGDTLEMVASAQDVALLSELLKGQDTKLRVKAGKALAKLGPAAKRVLPTVVETLKAGPEKELRAVLLEALSTMGGNAKEALPQILPALKDADMAVRRSAIAAVGGMGEDAKEAVPALADALHEPELMKPALEAIRKLGPVAGSAAPALAELLHNGQDNLILVIRTVQAIKPTARQSGAAAANLITLLGNLGPSKKQDVELRDAITDALGEMGKHSTVGPTSVVSKLIRALNDEVHPGTRMGAAMALGKIGPPAARLAKRQLQLHAQADEIVQVRDACNNALNRILNQ